MKVIGYVRVSTEEQAQSGLGIEAQMAVIRAAVELRGWTLHGWAIDEGWSTRLGDGPEWVRARELLKAGEADLAMVAKQDRLSRSTKHFAALLSDSQAEGWAMLSLDLDIDTTTSSGRLMAHIRASMAEWERDVISERTRDALAALKARGVVLGRPVAIPREIEAEIVGLVGGGMSFRKVAAALNARGVPTARGGSWGHSTVHAVVRRLERVAA